MPVPTALSRRWFLYLACLLLLSVLPPRSVPACTTAVASGRATMDGRPLLWKNRDFSEKNNAVIHSSRGRYAYLAVVNAGSSGSVWMGVNEAGFCIENSLIKDMPRGDKPGMGNGSFMRHALENCATVEEFQALLDETNKTQRGTQSNFGVIDARGGAAIFETGHVSYVKFDANDPAVAPHGYIVRSNFSMTGTGQEKLEQGGDLAEIYSGGRYLRAESLVRQAVDLGNLDHRYFLRHCCRDLADEQGCPLPGSVNGEPGTLPARIDTTATLSRRTSVSAAVFHGVRPGEDPRLTTMWVMLGEPAFAVAVPCWIYAEQVATELAGKKLSPLCSATLAIRKLHYDAEGKLLQSAGLAKIWEQTWPVEDSILRDTAQQLAAWRQASPGRETVAEFHQAMAERAMERLTTIQQQAAPVEPALSATKD